MLKSRIAVGMLVAGVSVVSPAWAAKPMAPITLGLTTSAPPLPGAVVDLTLSATPHLEADQLELDISVPAPIVLVSGIPHWSGPAGAQTTQTLTVRIRIPNAGHQRVHAAASVKSGTSRFAVHQSLDTGVPMPENRKPAAGVMRAPGAKANNVVEFPLQ
ncbi:MAG: hypothetical protein AABY83_09795 [Pseudomonadota bacterium]